jgi:hypothetical protein
MLIGMPQYGGVAFGLLARGPRCPQRDETPKARAVHVPISIAFANT